MHHTSHVFVSWAEDHEFSDDRIKSQFVQNDIENLKKHHSRILKTNFTQFRPTFAKKITSINIALYIYIEIYRERPFFWALRSSIWYVCWRNRILWEPHTSLFYPTPFQRFLKTEFSLIDHIFCDNFTIFVTFSIISAARA